MNSWEQYEAKMCAAFRFRRSRARICPRIVVGKRCLYDGKRDCVCQNLWHECEKNMLDHAAMWIDEAGQHVLTAEPYDVESDHLGKFREVMQTLGIVVTVHPKGYWYHGTTLLICNSA